MARTAAHRIGRAGVAEVAASGATPVRVDRASPAGAAMFNTRFVDGAPIAGSRDERRP